MTDFLTGVLIGGGIVAVPFAFTVHKLLAWHLEAVTEARDYAQRVNAFLTKLQESQSHD